MSSHDDFWYRMLFKVKLYEAYGTSFQQFINPLFLSHGRGLRIFATFGWWIS